MAATQEMRAKFTIDGITEANRLLQQFQQNATKELAIVGAQVAKLAPIFQSVGTALTVGVTLPLAAASAKVVRLGIDAAETRSLIAVSFGSMTKSVQDWSRITSASLVQSRLETQRQAAEFSNLAKAMGAPLDQAVAFGKRLTEISADLASFYNASPAEAQMAVRSGISGEAEPLRRFGTFLSDARLQQEAFNSGITDTVRKLDLWERSQATLNLILKDSSVAIGDVNRTADGTANQLRAVQARVTDLATDLGTTLLPVVAKGVDMGTKWAAKLQEVVDAFDDLNPKQQEATLLMFGMVAAAGPLLAALGGIAQAWTNIATAIGAAKLAAAGPWVLAAGAAALGIGGAIDFANRQRDASGLNGRTVGITIGGGSPRGDSAMYGGVGLAGNSRGAYSGTSLERDLAGGAQAQTVDKLRSYVRYVRGQYGIAPEDPEFNSLLRSMYPQLMGGGGGNGVGLAMGSTDEMIARFNAAGSMAEKKNIWKELKKKLTAEGRWTEIDSLSATMQGLGGGGAKAFDPVASRQSGINASAILEGDQFMWDSGAEYRATLEQALVKIQNQQTTQSRPSTSATGGYGSRRSPNGQNNIFQGMSFFMPSMNQTSTQGTIPWRNSGGRHTGDIAAEMGMQALGSIIGGDYQGAATTAIGTGAGLVFSNTLAAASVLGGPVGTMVGMALGSLLGGAAGGLFGSEERTSQTDPIYTYVVNFDELKQTIMEFASLIAGGGISSLDRELAVASTGVRLR